MPPRPLPRAYSSRYIPNQSVAKDVLDDADADADDDRPDGEDIDDLADDSHSLIGVSLGQRQTRLAAPTTSGAERQAAYHDSPAVDDIIGLAAATDGQADEQVQHDSDSDDFERDTSRSRRLSTAPLPARDASGPAPKRRGTLPSAPPSPWRAKPNDRWAFPRKQQDFSWPSSLRPRATSLQTSNDPVWKKFIPSLPKVSMPRLGAPAKSTSAQQKKAASDKPSFKAEDSMDSVPTEEEAEESPSREISRDAEPVPGAYQSIVPAGSRRMSAQRPDLLRRTTSDGSLYLQRALSHASSLGDDNRWADVHEQVNSRMKAIKDTLADSNLKLPSLPDITLPKLNHPWLDLDAARNRSRSLLAGRIDRMPSPRKSIMPTSKEASSPPETLRDKLDEAKDAARSPPPGMSRANAAAHPQFTRAMKKTKGDIVILGGYRGSVLRSAEPPCRQVWVPIKVGLNLRKVDLELGLSAEDEEHAEESIIPSGMLKNIGPVDISRRLFKRLSSCENAKNGDLRVWDYGYDWRLSPHLLSAQLIEFLEGLPCNSEGTPAGERGATVVAHSLGGLLTRHAINQRPELFSGVVFAGVPQNCVNILGPLRNGDAVLMSSKVLTAQVNFSIRTSFALLPLDGKCFFNKETGERYDLDFFDPQTWDDWHLSPVLNRPLPPQAPIDTSGPIEGFVNSMSSVLPSFSLTKARGSSPRPSTATPKLPSITDSSGTGAHQRAVGPEMSNRGDAATQHNENAEDNTSTAVSIPKPAAMAYLTRVLADIKRFKQELDFQPALEQRGAYPPCAVIYGKSVPTVYGARVRDREAIRHADAYDDLAFASGDGVVLARAAQIPPGYKVAKGGCVSSERGHVSLLGDLEAVGQCLNAVRVEKRLRASKRRDAAAAPGG